MKYHGFGINLFLKKGFIKGYATVAKLIPSLIMANQPPPQRTPPEIRPY